jgi:hypothetical protein
MTCRTHLGVPALDHDLPGQAGYLVHLLRDGNALADVMEFRTLPPQLGENRHRERIPFGERGAGFDRSGRPGTRSFAP